MDGPHLDPLPRFSTIGLAEKINVCKTLKAPLSGYLGGINKAGYFVTKLQDDWCDRFGVKHAVACNSATSGLLAACMAIGIKPGDTVWVAAMGMSATAACAKVLGADIVFIDIETIRFSMNMNMFAGKATPKCIIVTNLFGHPAYLTSMRSWCDSNKVWMIEDNAQSPFAKERDKYAGTVGHLGVFSLNVHKHIQAGEGGVVVSDDDDLAAAVAGAINHVELAAGINNQNQKNMVGLNLRMTEPIAAIACVQLAKAEKIIAGRIELANELSDMVAGIPWIEPNLPDYNCKSVYYIWAARITNGNRNKFLMTLQEHGFPMRRGYSEPLNEIFKSKDLCPVAFNMEYSDLITFEVCAYNPNTLHLRKMREIIKWAAGEIDD